MPAADPVRLIRAAQRTRETTQTLGMAREQAISSERVWAGLVRTDAKMASGWHHHGEYETAIYVVSGRLRMESGRAGKIVVEASAGDFLHVPPGSIHRETNPGSDEGVLIVVRAGSGAPVVNVDGPAA